MVFEEDGLEKLAQFSEDLEKDVFAMVSTTALGLGFTIFSIYLIATWSEQWNKQFK